MKKKYIVKENKLFNEIIQNGKRNSNKYYVLCRSSNNLTYNKFGIAVGTKVGNAVTRNKIKRQVRCIIDHNIKLFPNPYNYIIIVKKEILTISYEDMENKLKELI